MKKLMLVVEAVVTDDMPNRVVHDWLDAAMEHCMDQLSEDPRVEEPCVVQVTELDD